MTTISVKPLSSERAYNIKYCGFQSHLTVCSLPLKGEREESHTIRLILARWPYKS